MSGLRLQLSIRPYHSVRQVLMHESSWEDLRSAHSTEMEEDHSVLFAMHGQHMLKGIRKGVELVEVRPRAVPLAASKTLPCRLSDEAASPNDLLGRFSGHPWTAFREELPQAQDSQPHVHAAHRHRDAGCKASRTAVPHEV